MRPSPFSAVIPILLIATAAAAQNDDHLHRWLDNCDRSWNSDRARFCEVRNYTIAPTEKISVDGRENGGATIFGGGERGGKSLAPLQTRADHDGAAKARAQTNCHPTSWVPIPAKNPENDPRHP